LIYLLLYTNDNDINGSRLPILNITSEFFNGIHVKNMRINLGWNARINDTMVVDSIVMITCMSRFSKGLLDFNSMPKVSTLTKTCLFVNVVHAFLYKMISRSK
jgi:hypothetical protein